MEIKVTNYLLTDHSLTLDLQAKMRFIHPALQEFKKLKVPVSVAYNIIKSIGVVERAIKDYDSTRIAILESLCEKDAKGTSVVEEGKYKFSGNNHSEFNKKWQELLNVEISLEIFPISHKDIVDIKEINISCYETLMKYGFIQEDIQLDEKPTNGKASRKELIES